MFEYNWQRRIVAATPLICVFVYLLLGFQWDLWNQGLLVFLFVPIMPFMVGLKKFRVTFALLIFVIYIILGVSIGAWHPGWIIFLLIPIYHILTMPSPKSKVEEFFKKEKKFSIDAEFDQDKE